MTFARIKKRCSAPLFLLLLLAVSAGLSPQAVAHSGGRVYPIPELTDEMLEQIQLDDGTVDEWFELIGEPAMTLLDFQTHSNFLPPDPSNLDFRIWLAWHDDPDRLYLAFVASDDLYKNDHDYDAPYGGRRFIFVHDHITLAIDGDHSGGAGVYLNFDRGGIAGGSWPDPATIRRLPAPSAGPSSVTAFMKGPGYSPGSCFPRTGMPAGAYSGKRRRSA